MGANLVMAGLGVLTGSMVARSLGPVARGELAAIQNWAALLTTFGTVGIPQAVVYFSGRSADATGRTLSTGIIILLVGSLPLIVFGYVMLPIALAAQSSSTIDAARLYLIMIPLQFALGLPLFALQGRSKIRLWNLLRFVPIVGWLLVVVSAALTDNATPLYLITGNLLASAIAIFPIWRATRKNLEGAFRPDRFLVKPLMRYGVPAALANLPLVLNLRVDQLLMAAWLSPEVLGFYAVAVAWSGAITMLLSAVANITFPRLAATNTPNESAQLLARISRTSVFLSFILIVCFLSITPLMILILFGQNFRPAIPAAMILVIATGFAGLNQVLEDGLRGSGYPMQVFVAEAAGLLATIVLLTLLLRSHQLLGAAVSSLISYSIIFTVLLVRVKSILHVPFTEMLIPRRVEMVVVYKQVLQIKRLLGSHE